MQIDLVHVPALIFFWLPQHDCANRVFPRAVAWLRTAEELAPALRLLFGRVR